MVIFNPRRGKKLSRDEIVTRSEDAQMRSHQPWLYKSKIKSGRRRTRNVEYTAFNLKDLFGTLVKEHARENEVLSAYSIQRVMRAQLRSQREDY